MPWSTVGTLHSAHVLCTPWPWELLLMEMKTCTTAVPLCLGSEFTPCEYIPLQPACCWRKLSCVAALEAAPLYDMALGTGEHRTTGKKNIAGHHRFLFNLHNKRNAAKDRRPSKALARAVSTFTDNSQGQMEVEVLLASSWESTR